MDFSILGLWSQMGFIARTVVITLLLMSMFAIGIALERFLTFKKGKEQSIGFLAALQPMMAPGGDLSTALGLKDHFPDSPLARVAAVGLSEFGLGISQLGDKADDAIEVELVLHSVGRSMERAKKREMASLNKGLPVLATISSSAPFVGLFGTVFGIITAFQHMADPAGGGGGGLATVSAGIAEALLTTAVGLGVAIGAVWFYNYFTTRLDDLGGLIDDASGELTDRLVHKTRAGLASEISGFSAMSASAMAPAVAAPPAAAPPIAMAAPPVASAPPVSGPPIASTPPVSAPPISAAPPVSAPPLPVASRPPQPAYQASNPPPAPAFRPSNPPAGAPPLPGASTSVPPLPAAPPSAPPGRSIPKPGDQ